MFSLIIPIAILPAVMPFCLDSGLQDKKKEL